MLTLVKTKYGGFNLGHVTNWSHLPENGVAKAGVRIEFVGVSYDYGSLCFYGDEGERVLRILESLVTFDTAKQ